MNTLFNATLFLLFPLALFAQEKTSIGQVISVVGRATVKENGKEEVLKRGSSIYAQQVVKVDSGAKIQIKFTDGGLINFISDSEYEVDKYVFKTQGQKDEFAGNLLKGGFRSVSGLIAQNNPEGAKIRTPVATIGLQGTLYEVNFVQKKLYCGCERGKIAVVSPIGSAEIGPELKNQFALVTSTFPPQELSKRPNELDLDLFTSPEGGFSLESADLGIQTQAETGGQGLQAPQGATPGEQGGQSNIRTQESPQNQGAPGGQVEEELQLEIKATEGRCI
jgi:hypothetical protein